jgi:peptidyl-prolyl cis-trans isomerase B (cyclophilin B)
VAGKNERQRRQARDKYRRQQEIRAARRRQIRRRAAIGGSAVLAAALIASLLLVFLPGGTAKHPKASPSKSPSATPSATTVAEPAHHCSYTKATTAAARTVTSPPAAPDYTASYQATINTNLGKLVLSLANSKATCTVNSFVHLAEAGYFNNTQCHRLTTATGIYVLQCGDPYATATTKMTCSSTGKVGTGGPGYEFASENLTGAAYPAGTLAMANAGSADTNGSQFFIVYKDSSGLGASYTPFGTVSSGLDIVQNVAKDGFSCQYVQSGQSEGGAPKKKVIIDSVTIKKT